MDDANHGVVQVLHGRRYLAHRPHALLRWRRGVAAESVEPVATGHPLHDDEGVGGVEAGGDDLHTMRVANLRRREEGMTVVLAKNMLSEGEVTRTLA